MPEAVCENCGTAYPYHVKRGCSGRHILPPTEPQKEAVKPEAQVEEIAKSVQRQIKEAVEAWLESGEFDLQDRVRGIIVQALTEYAESLKER